MEWSNAKKFVIVLLVLLNLVLAGLNYRQRQENTMTSAQERAIFELLSQNGITLYTNLLTDASPMSRLSAEMPSYSKETLERLFFNGEKTTVTVGPLRTVYHGKDSTLTMEGASGTLERNGVRMGKENLSPIVAERTAERFLEQTEFFFGVYDEPVVREKEDGFLVSYNGVYKRESIFSNAFSVFVTEGGIRRVMFSYCPVLGYTGEKKDICHSDEALLTFLREWRKNEEKTEAAINRIELGYDRIEPNRKSADGMVYLEPCYRIYLMEREEPYLINAYTCQIVKKEYSAAE